MNSPTAGERAVDTARSATGHGAERCAVCGRRVAARDRILIAGVALHLMCALRWRRKRWND
jgi:hypothetical protein